MLYCIAIKFRNKSYDTGKENNLLHLQQNFFSLGSYFQVLITLHAKLCSVYCIVITPVCFCVYLFVGPPYCSQHAVFVSPLSAFSLSL